MDPATVATLLTRTTKDTTLVVGKDKLLDVLPARTVCCTTNSGMHVCTTVSIKQKKLDLPQLQHIKLKRFITFNYSICWK